MKIVLSLKLLGSPAVYLNQKEIFFSFSKINALLYYLLLNGTVSRDEVAGILWENKDNQTAKKNLRNTIYQANKILGQDVIISPNRTVLMLNPDIKIESDLADFSANPVEQLSLYQGDFLQGFYLRDSEAFDFWVSKMRAQFEQTYIKACYQKIESQMNQTDFEETEASLRRLIDMDEFEEKNYQLLMRLYQEHHRPGKVIETYYKLVNLLDTELGISPNEHIQQIYHEVLAKDRNERKTKQFLRNTDHFFGRVAEIKQLETYFSRILGTQESRAIVLLGGTGIGKRTVTRQVLANQTKYFQIVMSECFREEADLPLQPWRTILDGLSDLVIQHKILSIGQWPRILEQYFPILAEEGDRDLARLTDIDKSSLSQFIVDILQKISKKKALVLLIEDCHWMDEASLCLLQNVMNHLTDYPVAFTLTKHLNTTPHLEQFLNHLIACRKVEFIELQPLNHQESMDYLHSQLGDAQPAVRDLEESYRVSQGIPFFLSEYAKMLAKGQKFEPLTPAIKAKLALKIGKLTSREEELIHYLACFRGGGSLPILASLMLAPYEEIVEIIEALSQKHLLSEEYQGDELIIHFSRTILQIYCYESLSLAKRRILHNHIAQGMESLLASSTERSQLFNEIAYHYQMSKQALKALDYNLNYLELTLQFHHELFPIYSREVGFIEKTGDENQAEVVEQFEKIRRTMADLESHYGAHKDFKLLTIRFLYLQGRYDIRTGNYQQGIHHIQKVIASARELHNMDYLLEGYRQIIYYCIQAENIPEMRYYTELALDAAVQANNHEAIAIHLRLNGLYHLMIGEIDKAGQLIQQSIDCFSLTPSLQSKYAIQIAAALDYLAEIEQIRGNLASAIEQQKEAIELTEKKTAELSIITFYIGLGISYYLAKDNEEAERIFLKAREALQNLSFPWKETQLEVYLALIHCEQGDYQPVLDFLKKKESLISRYSNPRDKGMVYYLMAKLKYLLLTGSLAGHGFENLLTQPFDSYQEVAKSHLNQYRDHYQLEDLNQLKEKLQE